MQWSALLAFSLVAPNVHAFLRFPCSQLVTERFDPLVTPHVVSPHLHQIIGGNAFNVTMDTNNDLPTLSTCTTCTFKDDLSNYWTAVLYYKHPNGSFKRVPQMANQYTGSPNGGMTVYYIQPQDNSRVTAFKKGFRMLVGDPMLRANPNTAESNALSFRCFTGENFGGNIYPPGGGTDTHTLPNRKCPGGIRANIYFPSCWDGVNVDTPDHKSHVAYPTGGSGIGGSLFGITGRCPTTHPTRIPQILLETVWDTRQFNNMPWPTDGSQPFVYSMGDPTGLGQHADYVFGWKGDSLQRAMDRCYEQTAMVSNCRELTTVPMNQMNACTQRNRVAEPVDGWLNALPGCNPIQKGPDRALSYSGCGATTEYLPA